MKLAIIRRRYTPYGGAERFIERIASRLGAVGIPATIIAEKWEQAAGESGAPGVIAAKVRGWSRAARFRNFGESVAEILRNHSFGLVQSHERVQGADIYRAGDGVHAAWVDRQLREAGSMRAAWLRNDPYNRAVIEAERRLALDPHLQIVANSELVQNELQDVLGVPAERITLIPNGLDTARFEPPTEEQRAGARRSFVVPANALTIAFVGSGFARKGAFHLVESMRLMPEAFLLVCGRDKRRAALEALARKVGAANRVRILNGADDVRPVLHAADVFALPSLYDPSPNAALEALGCGLPVVTTADTGLAREIAEEDAGAICMRDPADIADKILGISGKDRRDGMAARARQLAMAFDQDLVIGRWLDLYRARMAAHS